MSRPRPSANTVSTVSTSPFRIRASRPLASTARSSGTGISPGDDGRRVEEAAQSAAILPARGRLWQCLARETPGVRSYIPTFPGWPHGPPADECRNVRPDPGLADRDGGDQEDKQDLSLIHISEP